LAALRRQQRKTAESGTELPHIRLEYKAKRNFMKALAVL